MVKIDKELLKRNVSRGSLPSTQSKKDSNQVEKPAKEFRFQMARSKANLVLEELKMLKAEIEEKGNNLADNLTWERFLDYKNTVKEFMEIYIKENHLLKETPGVGVRGRKKVYTLVNKVDEELNKLADAVLEGESGRIQAVSSITEIRGLLMDVFR
ncbi:YaaR family protein [Natranaerofaba carboxydovora]|uniref:YaaR family protein n=1 Tax=Natranaerofaba carboxydovora TaxID=2742683 RepID=UPI001F12C225|nr:YaaR family protein [Natranaerofaba carboxydovora]UMZ75239.1 hypothetical protein ACONDI_02858 [Natranaerofaba carboxydovora]